MALLQSHGASLYTLLYRLTLRHDVADDLMQELTIKLASAAGFARADNPPAYARTAAARLAYDWRRARRAILSIDTIAEPVTNPSSPLNHMAQVERLNRLLDTVAELPDPMRSVLTMRYIEQQSHAEIAEQLSMKPGAVRMTCHRAIRRLRDALSQSEREVDHA